MICFLVVEQDGGHLAPAYRRNRTPGELPASSVGEIISSERRPVSRPVARHFLASHNSAAASAGRAQYQDHQSIRVPECANT